MLEYWQPFSYVNFNSDHCCYVVQWSYFSTRDNTRAMSTIPACSQSVTGSHMLARHRSSVTTQRQRKYRGQEEMPYCSPQALGLVIMTLS